MILAYISERRTVQADLLGRINQGVCFPLRLAWPSAHVSARDYSSMEEAGTPESCNSSKVSWISFSVPMRVILTPSTRTSSQIPSAITAATLASTSLLNPTERVIDTIVTPFVGTFTPCFWNFRGTDILPNPLPSRVFLCTRDLPMFGRPGKPAKPTCGDGRN